MEKIRLYFKSNLWQIALAATIVILVAVVYYGVYKYRTLENVLRLESEEKAILLAQLEEAERGNLFLLEQTHSQQETINSFSGQISNISSTVGILEKLSQTDPELLKKYSKVYFLNENYVPAKLTKIEDAYIFDGGGDNFLVHAEVWPHLKRLLDAARDDNIQLLVASAFRSFDVQSSLKSEYKVIYGAGTANQFSADQGYSEHQLGTSVDFTTASVGGMFSTFESDPGYQWLINNAHKYGFVLSYPKGNAYYKFEPWHWRFVGVSLAERLDKDDKYFYDIDQREIDTYLIELFD